MQVIRARNVCQALPQGLEMLLREGVRSESRAGSVFVMPTPVTTVYERPLERVLTSPVRDANPFFHLAESVVWMLNGRDDAAFLNEYVRDFGDRFAEGNGRIHGAYGARWRSGLGIDQLDVVVERLRRNPGDRQCVIQMWDGSCVNSWEGGGETGHDDLAYESYKDRPCNLSVCLRLRETVHRPGTHRYLLDIMVTCRSNDILWGAYGANAVQFSVLQEYLAACIGVGVGHYYQVSWNYHAYEKQLEAMAARSDRRVSDLPDRLWDQRYGATRRPGQAEFSATPLFADATNVDAELERLDLCVRKLHADPDPGPLLILPMQNPALATVVATALRAHRLWRLGKKEQALDAAQLIAAVDWREACTEWMLRRMEK
jgi:thymidylate synthase